MNLCFIDFILHKVIKIKHFKTISIFLLISIISCIINKVLFYLYFMRYDTVIVKQITKFNKAWCTNG